MHCQSIEVALLGVFCQTLQHELVEPDRAAHIEVAHPRRRIVQVHKQHLGRCFRLERRAAGQQFKGDTAQRVQVGAAANGRLADNLLRSHVGVGADGFASGGECGRLGIAGDAEVTQLHTAGTRKKQICRLQVAVDNAGVMGMFQPLRDLPQQINCLFPGQRPLLFQAVFNGTTRHVLHRVEGLAAALSAAEVLHNVRVAQALQDRHFPLEPRQHLRVTVGPRRQQFHSNMLAVHDIHRFVDDTHPADTKLFLQ